MSPIIRTRTREPDELCVKAVDLARAAVAELVGSDQVGEHLAVEADGDRVVTHLFESLLPGLPRLALGGHRGQGIAVEAGDRQRGRAAARA